MRIRSIKPEFWTSEDIAALDWSARLLFIGLWSYVDDNGVGRDNEKLIKADLFPLEEDPRDTLATVSRGLQALCDGGQIARYEVDGKPFLYVNAWEDHQRIDRPNKPRYPLPTCENAIPRDTLATVSRDSSDRNRGTGEQGNRGTGEQRSRGTGEQRSRGTGEQRSRGTGEEGTSFAHSRSATDAPDPMFDVFWETYGKKVDRKKAEQKYRLALKKPGVTPDLLIAAAREYVAWETANNEGGRYIKHPSTWLNGECWRDERVARQQPLTRVQQHLALAQQLAAEEQTTPNRQIGGT